MGTITLPDRITGIFTGSGVTSNFWLYWSATFFDLLMVLLSAVVFYNTTKSLCATRKSSVGPMISQPINLYKIMIMCVTAVIFLRVFADTVILLLWQEATTTTMDNWQQVNQFMDALAFLPFMTFMYLILRAGPVLEFQLLRQPIPTDLHLSWKMMRSPVVAFTLIVLLSFMVVSTKLFY